MSAAQTAQDAGLDVHQGTLESYVDDGRRFDLVCAWMVLEHVDDPVKTLRTLRTLVKPDGWLSVTVPNVGSLDARMFKGYWYARHAPAHLTHFTPRTVRNMLAQTGWETDRVLHQRVLTNYVGSLSNLARGRGMTRTSRLTERLRASTGFNAVAWPAAAVLAALGQTGRMTVWARRS